MRHFVLVIVSIITMVGCSANEGRFKVIGESKHWNVYIEYELQSKSQKIIGQLTYTKENPPKEISYELIYPNGFDGTWSGGSASGLKNPKEKQYGIGGTGTNDGKYNFKTYKDNIGKTDMKVTWKQDGNKYEETIQLNVK